MRILHVDTGREMRGGQWQVLLLAQALGRRGHAQEILAPSGSPLLEGAGLAGLAARPLRWWPPLPNADVVHAHDARAHTTAALRAGKPLVVSRRVAFPVGRGWLSRWKYARADHYIAVSRSVARELQSAGVPAAKITVVLDGVRLPDIARAVDVRADFRRRLALRADDFVAGAITTLREKPMAPLLEAAGRRPRLRVVIASSDTTTALSAECPENVRLFQPESDLSPLLFGLDVFVHLSESEGLGSAALLAMAHGVPVIASNVGGLPEIVRPGETGWLVRNTAEEVGAALEAACAAPAASQEMGRRGRQFVEAQATDDIMAKRTETVYREVTSDE
jgi:glycosyltransferase involved in cell wall biosynthesis